MGLAFPEMKTEKSAENAASDACHLRSHTTRGSHEEDIKRGERQGSLADTHELTLRIYLDINYTSGCHAIIQFILFNIIFHYSFILELFYSTISV